MKLGLDVEEIAGRAYLPVRQVNGGLAAKWNQDHSDRTISPGDRIMQVNGVANDVAGMMRKCRTDKVLKMVLMPAVELETAPAAQTAPAAPAPAPAAVPYQAPAAAEEPRGAPSFVASGSAVDQMMELGIEEARAREALEIAGNDLTMALEVCGHRPAAQGGPAPAPAPSPQRPEVPPPPQPRRPEVPPPPQQDAGLRQLMDMGYPEAQAARVLSDNNGDLDTALAVLMSGGESPGGGGGGRGGGGGQDTATREQLATLTGMGFQEDACRQALKDANGNVEQATTMLLSAA